MKGFDEYAYIILQQDNGFKDVKQEQQADQAQRVLPLINHMKYIFPGEFDALISFAPTAGGNS